METSKGKLIIYVVLISMILTGCATVQTKEEWARVKGFILEKTGKEALWEQKEEDANIIKAEINRLLSDDLTEDEAISIAILNNRRLQSAFEEIGIAKSDLVQAGLFSNPKLSLAFLFPFSGGGIDIEAALPLKISDIWQIPHRKRIAATRLEEVLLKIKEEIINVISDTRRAYLTYAGSLIIREEIEKLRDYADELKEHVKYRQRFGFSTDLDIYMAESLAIEQELELAKAERDIEIARLRLNRILGLSSKQIYYNITTKIPEEFKPIPDSEIILNNALNNRPDIQIAIKRVEESRHILELEKRRILPHIEIGPSYTHESDGGEFIGPKAEIEFPLFDQNQAQIAKAEYRIRQAEKELQEKIDYLREDILSCLERISFIDKEIALFRKNILPLRESALNYAEKYFNAMQINMLYLIEAKKNLTEARANLIKSLIERRSEEIELERITGINISININPNN